MPPRKFKVTTKTKLPALKESYDERSLYPWMTIRTEYIEGFEDEDGTWAWPGIKELAERYEIPEKQLQNRINKERWIEYKKAHQNQIALERQKEHAKRLTGRAIKFDEQSLEIAEFANGLIMDRLNELAELQDLVVQNRQIYIEAIEAGEEVSVSKLKASAYSGSELESIAKAFAMFAETGRKALGIKDGESPINQTTTNITVQQTNIREDLNRTDADRMSEMMRILGNPNLSLPGVDKQPLALEGEVVEDADIVEDEEIDDTDTE